ncbi:CPK3 [Symbiodinium natans]|uniref:non-specific serine/threonine protein kinase n=1 Tax=Symbiodinium natans TaxID=878477 RepID=A0A812H9D0_9DINO|nr:CPK3 [Symbiodinium natans]
MGACGHKPCGDDESEEETASDSQGSDSETSSLAVESGESASCCARYCNPFGCGDGHHRGHRGRGPTQKVFFVENSGKDVRDYFEFDEHDLLGEGGFAKVCRCQEKKTGIERALKIIVKQRVPQKERENGRLEREMKTMFSMDHPNIIKVFQYFEDSKQIYLIMECCKGGELFDAILEQGRMSEADAATIMQQIFKAMVYMHENGVCHRDLKPENFLFLKKAPIRDNVLKIIDFGIAAHFEASRHSVASFSSKVGTPYYVAPEVLPGFARYSEKVDCWSAGVVMYILLSGIFPFKGEGTKATLNKVKLAKITFPPEAFQGVSKPAKELIKKLLQKSPEQRLSAKEALKDPWVTSSASLPTSALSGAVMDNLRKYSAEHRFKKAALHVLARHQDEGALSALRETFTQLDQDGDGIITFNELKQGLKTAGFGDQFSNKDLQDLAKAVDADGSGEIDYTEFIAAAMERQAVVQESTLWAAFRVFDKNDDGRISMKELQEVLGTKEANKAVSKDNVKKILSEVDKNGDGFIDFNEFIEMMRT